MITRAELQAAIDRLPRVTLANFPTPLEEVPRLTRALMGPRLLFKRDDLTGLALGGNKARMLEFRLAEAMEEEADVVVAGFDIQSNHARQIAAACSKLGLEAYLILRKACARQDVGIQGNLLLDLLVGARIEIVEAGPRDQELIIEKTAHKLRWQGRRPYITGISDRDLSAIAYVECTLELCEQLERLGIDADYLFVASEGSTQAGLILGAKCLGSPFRVVGVNPVDWVKDVPARIAQIANDAAKRLRIDLTVDPSEVVSLDSYLGEGYGEVTPGCIEAIRLVAQTEGILLDPIYTGKAMAGLIDEIRRKVVQPGQTVIFLHTGGFPTLFAYAEELGLEAGNIITGSGFGGVRE